jgi:XTP/dITP diphosphohydrolase
MELLFASQNPHKLSEVKAILSELPIQITGLAELFDYTEVEENGNSFRENAFLKSSYFYNKYKKPIFGDDSGLIVPALNGEPGIYSARYGGEHGNHYLNNLCLLKNMETVKDRGAYFLTVICYIDSNGQAHFFEGHLNGEIAYEITGENGFGYDPVFLLPKYGKTLAELGTERKNQLSHRFMALKQLVKYLKKEVE